MFDGKLTTNTSSAPFGEAVNRPWRGIIPPLATPLLSCDELDLAGLERLIAHALSGGVHGLFILGTTGEAPHLSQQLRRQMIAETCRIVDGRTRVMVGVSDTSVFDAATLGEFAADCGADALVSAAPFYFQLNEVEMVKYMRRLSTETPLPLFLYNMPQMVKSHFTTDALRWLMESPRVAGLKDSGGNLEHFKEYLAVCRERPDWSVFVGPEQLLCEALAVGADGGISGGANINPRLFVDAFEASRRGDLAEVSACQVEITRLGELYGMSADSTASIQGIKAALAALGICENTMASPFQVSEDLQRSARQVVAKCGLAELSTD
jgi:4-hydroxy-tetrahydrodipicolinate synthase